MVDGIVKAPDPILRQKCLPVKKVTPKIKELAKEMVDFMDNHSEDASKPIGLSACQLGQAVRMIAFRCNPQSLDRDDIQILINPVLVYGKKQQVVNEGCSSLPGKLYQLKRFKIAKIRGTTLDGIPRSFRGRDLLGQVFQHELNHLDGLMLDIIGERAVE